MGYRQRRSVETEDRSNFKMTTKWRNERDKSTFYFALFAYALTSSGTPGSYRAIAKLSEERPYLITLDVESKMLYVANETQEEVNLVAKGIRSSLLDKINDKLGGKPQYL